MQTRAEFQKGYLKRYLLMACICISAGLWFAYDGFIGYPANLPAAEAYDALREIPDDAEKSDRWRALAEENEWPRSVPVKTADDIRNDITGQYIWMAICFLGGVPALLYYFNCRDAWVERTEGGIRTSWGQEFQFSQVNKLDKKRWAKKGIAVAHYAEEGTNGRFVFDDFKFDREPIGKMLSALEELLPRDQIVGGLTEAEHAEEKAKAKAAEAEADESKEHDGDSPT